MTRAEVLNKLDCAIAAKNPTLLRYLRPGLMTNAIERRLKGVSGLTEPLFDLYSWHDGTDFVHLGPGETFVQGMEKITIIPGARFHFVRLELAASYMQVWDEAARKRPNIKQMVGRYFTLFYDGADEYIMLDLDPSKKGRVIHYTNESHIPFRKVYETIDELLHDILHATENGIFLKM